MPEPGQPEGYNRYAYANGNPLRFSDPSGHIAFCFQGGPNPEINTKDGNFVSICTEMLLAGGYNEEQLGEIVPALNGDLSLNGNALIGWLYEDYFEKAVAASERGEPIIIIGHSYGGEGAMTLAMLLGDPPAGLLGTDHAPIPVDLLVTIDKEPFAHDLLNFSYFPLHDDLWQSSNTVPNNVAAALNVAASPDWWVPEWGPTNGIDIIEGAHNFKISGTDHWEVASDETTLFMVSRYVFDATLYRTNPRPVCHCVK